MPYALCRHIRTNGRRCNSPAIKDTTWCFFHKHLYRTHKGFRHDETSRAYLIPGQHLELNSLEDRESVQLALSMVINALATGQLDSKRATALLYGLQVASNNAVNLDSSPGFDAVREVESTPEGVDLAQPAVKDRFVWVPRVDSDSAVEDDDDEDDADHYDD